jgi:hypothetical protein
MVLRHVRDVIINPFSGSQEDDAFKEVLMLLLLLLLIRVVVAVGEVPRKPCF